MNETKKHIILITSKLFLQKNFKEVTLSEIVKETGLSKGAFYHYFQSKEQLFLEVVDYFFQSFTRNYENYSQESLQQFYTDYMNETLSLFINYQDNFRENSGHEINKLNFTVNYFSLMFDALKLLPEFRDKAMLGFDTEINHWAKAIESARKRGEIKKSLSNKEIAEIFMYLSDGIAMHMIFRGADMNTMINLIKNLWDTFYNLIKT